MSCLLRLSLCLAGFLSWCRLDVLAVATTLNFDGSQYLKVSLPGSRTEVEDISLRFKTDHPSGLLLATSNRDVRKRSRIEMVLMNSRVNLSIDLGSGIQVCSVCYVQFFQQNVYGTRSLIVKLTYFGAEFESNFI